MSIKLDIFHIRYCINKSSGFFKRIINTAVLDQLSLPKAAALAQAAIPVSNGLQLWWLGVTRSWHLSIIISSVNTFTLPSLAGWHFTVQSISPEWFSLLSSPLKPLWAIRLLCAPGQLIQCELLSSITCGFKSEFKLFRCQAYTNFNIFLFAK